MILDEITLRNFGVYGGSQRISLTPPSPDKPIVLIGGLNGGGKTTLLDALQLCLFGAHARLSSRGSLAYSEYLSRAIHRGSNAVDAAIQVSFTRTIEGREEHYELHRSWQRTDGGCKESFEVIKNGMAEPVLSDNWANQVEEFFPANIAHLFLFDGEQVEAYASHQNSSALIGTAIQSLLGLDIVDQLEKDLQVYERRKRAASKDDPVHAEITAAQDAVRDLRSRLGALKQERAALRTHRIDRTQRTLRDLEDRYRKLGGALYDQREDIERKWSEARQAVERGKSALRELADGALPMLLVRDLLLSVERRDRREQECRRARDLHETLKVRDRAALKHLRQKTSSQQAVDALKFFFEADRAERQALGKEETILDLLPQASGDLRALLDNDIDEIASRAARLLKKQHKLEAIEAQAQIELENVPSADTIAQIAADCSALKQEIAELESMYAAISQEIERQERELERREQALARLIETDAREKGARDDRERILHHARRVRTTLGAFRLAVIGRHVHRIEQLVLESYQHLLRKSALITRLTIDPESYALTLFGRDSKVIGAEQLSAGERQLLAIALLWGLAKASGRPLPTAIDTPLGRLDTDHRVHLAERYFPFASHQVLLLSTNEEIAGTYLRRLEPWIGRMYQLAYDDAAGSTRIVPGYFEVREAA